METACLRVKFRPLLRNVQHEGSNCRVEIVPEICNQNLTKIKWRAENDSIEYTVPMTYKIILKKRENHFIDAFDNTYHSCLDLLQSSSFHNDPLQSGDVNVNHIISENFILSRLTRNLEYCNKILNINCSQNLENENRNSQNTSKTSQDIQSHNNTIFNKTTINSESTNESYAGSIEFTYPQDFSQEKNKTVDASTAYEPNLSDENNETISSPYNFVVAHPPYQRLSLSPICSINTEDCNVKAIECNQSLYYYVSDAQGVASFIRKLSSSNAIPKKISETIKQDQADVFIRGKEPDSTSIRGKEPDSKSVRGKEPDSKSVRGKEPDSRSVRRKEPNSKSVRGKEPDNTSIRKSPEVRVAEIVSDMHRQVYPLQKMLNDILHKCAVLEIQWDKNIVKKKIVNKNPSYCNYNDKCNRLLCGFQRGKKSNRVVYSIVFDG